MSATHQQAHAELMLRTMLDRTFEPPAAELDWAIWQRLAGRNSVLVRLAERLSRGARPLPPELVIAATREAGRARTTLAWMETVAGILARHGIPHAFLKVRRHYPDLGSDVDVLVPSSRQVNTALVRELGARPAERTLDDRVAGAEVYQLDDGVVLDVHRGRLGRCGEQRLLPDLVLERRRQVRLGDTTLWVPSPEDEILLQGLQQVRGRLSFRLAAVLYTIVTLRAPDFDWEYLTRAARRIGLSDGLSCYLTYVGQIHQRLFASALLPAEAARALWLDEWGQVEFRDGAFRFPTLRVNGWVYASQFSADVRSGRWASASRLCLLPLVAAAAGLKRLVPAQLAPAQARVW